MLKKKGKEISLSEKLSSLIHTKPAVVESDDEDLTTIDKIAVNENDSEYSTDELDVPKFRKVNNKFLDEDDSKYSGKGISRKDFNDPIGSDFDETEDSLNDENNCTEDYESGSHASYDDDDDDEEGKDEDENPSENESVAFETSFNENNSKLIKHKQESNNFNQEFFHRATNDIEKGKGIKNQLHIWDILLDCRMKFQKCLTASNQFPSYKNFVKFKNQGGKEFENSILKCKSSLKYLLHSLLTVQELFLISNEEFLKLSNYKNKSIKTSLDEDDEINSDTENESEKNQKLKLSNLSITKLKKLSDFKSEIESRHKLFENYRNNVIEKWNDKTRIGYISSKNFSAFEQSTLKQIEHILLDKSRLIKRTQTKRSNYCILGENDEPAKKVPKFESTDSVDMKSNGLQKEIFDDDDFYHQLLSELVKRKGNDVTDPVQLGRQWIQLQKIRSKMKKTVDVKASKGRKVRFVVHPKLVNFMMPINNSFYSEDSKIELFNSLFGASKK